MKKIIIVEDDAVFLKILGRFLNANGFSALETQDAKSAKQIIDGHPDLEYALIDQFLPDEDGIEVLRYIQNRGLAAKVIMMSRHETAEQTREFKDAGAASFVKKPINPKQILALLEEI